MNGLKNAHNERCFQVHWNNPELVAGLWDGSGLQLHFTPNLGQRDLATFMTMPMDLEIPPGESGGGAGRAGWVGVRWWEVGWGGAG